ncbi:MAG: hypothetical protein GY827_06100 [Cytophagales bacterium]|nr:hypothetical protein [Cytophagales bacterium]
MRYFKYLAVVFIALLFFQCSPTIETFKNKGVKTKGKIAFKQLKVDDEDYLFVVYFFTHDTLSSHNLQNNPIWDDKKLSLEEKVNKWNHANDNVGDFFSAEIPVSYKLYTKYKEGDVVDVIFLPDDPHKAILKEMIPSRY